MRAQTSLPAVAIAFLLLTAGLVVAVTAAGSAFDSADRSALDRQAALALSDRLVAGDAPWTARTNVIDAERVESLTPADLRDQYGLSADAAVRVRLGDRTLLSAGDPTGGVTVDRLVLVEHRENRTLSPSLGRSREVTLPRRTPRIALGIQPPANTTVRAVRVDGRVRLRNPDGLAGTFEIPLSTGQTPTIRFDATGSLPDGSVRIRYFPAQTEKTRLEVTVDG